MSLLMQALKKAEHAKQKQSNSPSTDVAEEKNPLKIQTDETTLSPQETSQASPAVNLDMLDMELSPVVAKHTPQIDSEPAMTEPVYSAEEPEPVQSDFDTSYSQQNKAGGYAENSPFDSSSRPNTEALSQQLTAKMRLDQQKAAALESGKALAEQQKAKAVFTAKQPAGNRRTLWIAVVGLLVVSLFLGGGYYYVQLASQNSSPLVKPLPIQAAPAPMPAITPEPTPVKDAANDAATIQTASVQTTPVTQKNTEQPAAMPTQKIPHAASGKLEPEQGSVQRKRTLAATAEAGNGAEGIEIRQTTTDGHINPSLSKAYQFFMSGDLAAAQQQYQTVLQNEPNNHDALLGMASIAITRKQDSQAGSYYLKLLDLDPSDPDAIAGLTGLQGGDASEMESRLKKALAHNPQSGALMFALGNLYARQSRWSDAQQSYFQAYGAAPNNPDYAFNLAISLDRLEQKKLALEFYQRALTLAQNKPGNFNKVAIQDRINQLQSAIGS